jgi:drug/metabolite transporter (DMT)-like permease
MIHIIEFFAFLIVCTILGAFGGFGFKKAIASSEGILKVIFQPFLYIGGTCYLFSAILNIVMLKKFPYTVVLPSMGITYIWTFIISHKFLNEKITKLKISGVFCIILGSFIIGMSM